MFSSSGTAPIKSIARISTTSSIDIMSPFLTISILRRLTIKSTFLISLASNKPIILSASLIAETSGVVTTNALSAAAIAFWKPCSIPAGQSRIM